MSAYRPILKYLLHSCCISHGAEAYGTKTKEVICTCLNLNTNSYVLFPKPRCHAPELAHFWLSFSMSTD